MTKQQSCFKIRGKVTENKQVRQGRASTVAATATATRSATATTTATPRATVTAFSIFCHLLIVTKDSAKINDLYGLLLSMKIITPITVYLLTNIRPRLVVKIVHYL